jgi:hypothetical protein
MKRSAETGAGRRDQGAQPIRRRAKRASSPAPRIGSAAINRIASIVAGRLAKGHGYGNGELSRMPAPALPAAAARPVPADAGADTGPQPQLYMSMSGFNFVRLGSRHFAIPHLIGAVDVRSVGFPQNYKGVSEANSFAGLIGALAWRWVRWAYWEGSKAKFHEIR